MLFSWVRIFMCQLTALGDESKPGSKCLIKTGRDHTKYYICLGIMLPKKSQAKSTGITYIL